MIWSSDWVAPARSRRALRPSGSWSPAELVDRPPPPSPSPEEKVTQPAAAAVEEQREEARRRDEAKERAERQAELEEAWNRGFDAGVAETREQQQARIASAIGALEAAVAAVNAEQSRWADDARDHIIALATAVARHIVGRELRGDPHALADLARRALAQFPASEPVRVRIHPEDLAVLTSAVRPDGGSIAIAPGRDVRWVADEGIARGGCVVEGRRRVVDGRIDYALERIFQRLADD